MNFLGMSVLAAAFISIMCGIAGANYEKPLKMDIKVENPLQD